MAENETGATFASWLTPSDTLALLSTFFATGLIANIVLERLKGGKVRSAALNSSWELIGGATTKVTGLTNVVVIAPRYWGFFDATKSNVELLWTIGDVRFYLGADGGRRKEAAAIRYYGVRFFLMTFTN